MAIASGNCQRVAGASYAVNLTAYRHNTMPGLQKTNFNPSAVIQLYGDVLNNYNYDSNTCDSSIPDTRCTFFRAV